jgi:hypothetical protein
MEVKLVVFIVSQKLPITSFFKCHYVKFLWHAIHVVLGISPPVNTKHMFNSWSK